MLTYVVGDAGAALAVLAVVVVVPDVPRAVAADVDEPLLHQQRQRQRQPPAPQQQLPTPRNPPKNTQLGARTWSQRLRCVPVAFGPVSIASVVPMSAINAKHRIL